MDSEPPDGYDSWEEYIKQRDQEKEEQVEDKLPSEFDNWQDYVEGRNDTDRVNFESWQDYVENRDGAGQEQPASEPKPEETAFDKYAPNEMAGEPTSEQYLDEAQEMAETNAVPEASTAEATHNAYMARVTEQRFEVQEHTGEQAQDLQTATLSQEAQEQIDQMPDEAKAQTREAGEQIQSVFDKYAEQSAEADQEQEAEHEPERNDDR